MDIPEVEEKVREPSGRGDGGFGALLHRVLFRSQPSQSQQLRVFIHLHRAGGRAQGDHLRGPVASPRGHVYSPSSLRAPSDEHCALPLSGGPSHPIHDTPTVKEESLPVFPGHTVELDGVGDNSEEIE